MDIRNFFGKNSRKKSSPEREEIVVVKKKGSRNKGILFDSDSSDQENIVTKKVKKEILKTPAKTRKSPRKKVANTPKLSKTTPDDFFGNTPVKPKIMKRKSSADKHESKPKILKRECIDLTDDDLDAFEISPQPKKSQEATSKKLSKLMNQKNDAKNEKEKLKPSSTAIKKTNGVKKESHDASNIIPATPPAKLSTKPNKELENVTDSAKKEKFLKYQQWQNRSGPSAPGSKEVPKGADNCFEGLTFVITGVQESLTRDEIKSLVERYSGKVTTTVSSRTKYLITGDDAGESKLKKAAQHKTKIIDEDEFLDLIRTLPAKKSKYSMNEEIPTKSKTKEISPKKVKSELDVNKNSKIVPKEEIIEKVNSKISPKQIKSEKLANDMESPKINSQNSSQGSPSKQGLMWVDKYKPTTLKQIIGQQGPSSNVNKLLSWLKNWHFNNRTSEGKAKPKPKMNQWGGGDPTGCSSKAALLSGPPGVGKTTTATLVCQELGYEYVELNASDTRSKRSLKEDVAASVENSTIGNMFSKKFSKTRVQNVLIMDEVDGMAGNEDRGGMSELIQIIKTTKIPIICMCNDRASPKMKSLTNHCFDLRFQRPRVEQITGAVMSICFKEGLKVQAPSVQSIIRGCNQDVRQVLHNLNIIKSNQGSLDYDSAQAHSKKAFKDVNMGIFDVAHKLMSNESASMNINEKSNLFFMDYSMMPKFVQDNYLMMSPIAAKGNKQKHLNLLSKTADDIAVGDCIESTLRHSQAWSLLPTLGLISTVIPCDVMRGGLQGRINFPSFFGKLSKTTKSSRLLQELKFHSSLATGGSTERTFNLDVLPYLRWHLTQPLIEQTQTGNQELQRSTTLLSDYDMLRDDFDSIVELGQFPGYPNPITKIDSKVKSMFTRAYNKEGHMIPYSMLSTSSAKKGKVSNSLEELDSQEKESAEEESGDEAGSLESDKMIKQKKKPAAKRGNTAAAKKEKAGMAPKKKKKK